MHAFGRAAKAGVARGHALKGGRPSKALRTADAKDARASRAKAEDSDESWGDEVCTVCNSGARASSMLLCDGTGCDVAMHTGCASPPLCAVPRGDWFCQACDPYVDVGPRIQKPWMQSPSKASRAAAAKAEQAATGRGCARAAGTPAAIKPSSERALMIRRLRAAARDLHYSSTPESLLCRAPELAEIMRFVDGCTRKGSGQANGSLYVSGTPGNGKSVTISRVREQLVREMRAGLRAPARLVSLNGFAFVDAPLELFSALDTGLGCASSLHSPAARGKRTDESEGGAAGACAPLAAYERGKASALAALSRLELLFAPASAAAAEAGLREAGQAHTRLARGLRSRGEEPTPAASSGKARPASATPVSIVFIDEIDALYAAKGEDVLCRLFEWGSVAGSNLLLVGIANAIDLTDRMIPSLARRGCTPQVLTFKPYSPEDIIAILEERLSRAAAATAQQEQQQEPPAVAARAVVGQRRKRPSGRSVVEAQPIAPAVAGPAEGSGSTAPAIVSRGAIELCARRVCATSSDARRALDICRGALELVLAELERESSRDEGASEGTGVCSRARAGACVGVAEMARAVSLLVKSCTVELCAALPQHQQLFLCAAVLHERRRKAAVEAAKTAPPPLLSYSLSSCARPAPTPLAWQPTTVRVLYEVYCTLCREQHIRPISHSELVPACQALSSSGLLHVSKQRAQGGRQDGRSRPVAGEQSELDSRVSIAIPTEELQHAVHEVRFFRQILEAAATAGAAATAR